MANQVRTIKVITPNFKSFNDVIDEPSNTKSREEYQ